MVCATAQNDVGHHRNGMINFVFAQVGLQRWSVQVHIRVASILEECIVERQIYFLLPPIPDSSLHKPACNLIGNNTLECLGKSKNFDLGPLQDQTQVPEYHKDRICFVSVDESFFCFGR